MELAANNHENQLKLKWSELDLHFGDWGKEYSLSLSSKWCSTFYVLQSAQKILTTQSPFSLYGIEFVEVLRNVYLKMVRSEEMGLKIHKWPSNELPF